MYTPYKAFLNFLLKDKFFFIKYRAIPCQVNHLLDRTSFDFVKFSIKVTYDQVSNSANFQIFILKIDQDTDM